MSEPPQGQTVIGPVDLMVFSFETPTVGSAVVDSIRDVVASGDVTVLDLVLLSRDDRDAVSVLAGDAAIERLGLASPPARTRGMIGDDDLAMVREGLPASSSALVVVFENTWARAAATAITESGGQVELHVRIPAEVAQAALGTGTDSGLLGE